MSDVKEFIQTETWKRQVIGVIRGFKPGTRFTSDEVRCAAAKRKIGEPINPNHWGRIVQTSGKILLARKTGKYRPTARTAGHNRVIAEWVRL